MLILQQTILSKVFDVKGRYFLLPKCEDKVVGSCGLYPTEGLPEGHVELVKFYISKEARGTGVGRLFMEKCYEQAEKFGYTHIYLESLPAFGKAISIYEKQGFEQLSAPLGNSGHTGCDIWMLKRLYKLADMKKNIQVVALLLIFSNLLLVTVWYYR